MATAVQSVRRVRAARAVRAMRILKGGWVVCWFCVRFLAFMREGVYRVKVVKMEMFTIVDLDV